MPILLTTENKSILSRDVKFEVLIIILKEKF